MLHVTRYTKHVQDTLQYKWSLSTSVHPYLSDPLLAFLAYFGELAWLGWAHKEVDEEANYWEHHHQRTIFHCKLLQPWQQYYIRVIFLKFTPTPNMLSIQARVILDERVWKTQNIYHHISKLTFAYNVLKILSSHQRVHTPNHKTSVHKQEIISKMKSARVRTCCKCLAHHSPT